MKRAILQFGGSMVEVINVSKTYGNITALENLNLSVPKGQVLGLLGQNGAGKSTLLNILAGCIPATNGRVIIGSSDFLKDPLKAKSFIGFLPEHPPVYPEMTVFEYLLFCSELKGVVKKDRREHIHEIIELTGLKSVESRLISNLSKGYQQRTGLAQALCGTPDVLLLDEPSSGFDPSQLVEFRKLIKSLSKLHTIILSSHLISEVQSFCDRIIILHQGRMVYDHIQDEQSAQNQFYVRIMGKPDQILPALRGLPSVIKVKPMFNDEVFEANIHSKSNMSFETELFCLLSGMGTPIMELRLVEDNLENIFVSITSSKLSMEAC